MRQALVETDPGANPVGELRGQPRPEILVPRLSGSEHDEARIQVRKIV